MAQSDARFGYQAKLSRESHDLSSPFGFTCCPGMELPVFADIVSAGDYLEVKHDLPFLRTNPLASPAMVDIKVHFETFFVPMQMLYQPFENVMYGLNNFQSSNFAFNRANEQFPVFNYDAYVSMLTGVNYQHSQERQNAFRLADMLRLQGENFCVWHGETSAPWKEFKPNFFPWQILAYNTIWNYYFRLDDKSQFANSDCNWDMYYDNTEPVQVSSIGFMTIHSRPWDFDYYTSIYRSPIISDANVFNLPAPFHSDLTVAEGFPIDKSGLGVSTNHDITQFSNSPNITSSASVMSSISTAAIRQMFANEKLAMITGRTRKNYDSQVLAHLGVNVPIDVKHDLQLIGRDTYAVSIGEVTSLASTDGTPLGDLAGKGWASSHEERYSHEKHTFKAPVDGVVMTLFCVEPLKRNFGGFARQNLVSESYDLPRPEFDRLGNVPMFGYEVGGNQVQSYNIVGWKERYYEWKRRSAYTTLAFANPAPYQGENTWSTYMLSQRPYAAGTRYDVSGLDIAATYEGCHPEYESRFYIPFNALDNIMLEAYQYGWLDMSLNPSYREDWDNMPWLVYQRDPIIVDCYPTVKKVSWMSKDGEPVYPY